VTVAATETRSDERRRQRVYDRLVDVDIHPTLREGVEVALPYMPRRWRDVFEGLPPIPSPGGISSPVPMGNYALTVDATPPDGSPPGSDPRFMVEDFFDRYEVGIAQLILLEPFYAAGLCADPEMNAVLLSAFNDWFLDQWLVDERMRYALLVGADPALAAAEVRRLGPDPRVCSVSVVPARGKALGDSFYFPIYEAALELELPVITHLAFAGFPAPGVSYVETRINKALGAWVQVVNLVLQGTFERYPRLKVMIIENGFTWLVPLMWRVDAGWRRSRAELPWLKRWPSEYIRDHIRLSTQPLDDDQDPEELYRLIESETTHLSDVLCYASDYPHWDNDRPGRVLHKLSPETKRKLFCDNATEFLRL
jgi:predicted TIM-barrel fold metal-dependent hydrolase